MPPHSSCSSMESQMVDAIEIQHVAGRGAPIVRLVRTPVVEQYTRTRDDGGRSMSTLAHNSGATLNRLQQELEREKSNLARRQEQQRQRGIDYEYDDTVVVNHIPSSDSGDQQDSIFDTFSSMCLPMCGPGCYVPPKSALKKPGQGHSAIQSKRSVSFNSLTVREYDLTLGDHPSSASGPPVQLDWECKKESVVDLNKYEHERQPRKTRRQLKMSFQEREQILQSKGYSMDELKNAWMESLKVRQQRYETIMTGSLTTKVEEAWESACRKFNRLFTLTQDMEGYEVKVAGETAGSREAFSYVKNTEEDDFLMPTPATATAQPTTNWSLFDIDVSTGSGCAAASSLSWLVPCSGPSRPVVS